MTDATTITISIGLLGTIASGAGVWAVALYRLRQCERSIAELKLHDAEARTREEMHRTEREAIRHRITVLESRQAAPSRYLEVPTPIQGIPWED